MKSCREPAFRGADFSIGTIASSGTSLFSTVANGVTDELTFTLVINATASQPVNFAQLSAATTGSGGTLSIVEGASGNPFPREFGASNMTLAAAEILTNSAGSQITSTFDLNYHPLVKLVGTTGEPWR